MFVCGAGGGGSRSLCFISAFLDVLCHLVLLRDWYFFNFLLYVDLYNMWNHGSLVRLIYIKTKAYYVTHHS